jgi:hypothetical protein
MENLNEGEPDSFSFLRMIVGLAMCLALVWLFLTSLGWQASDSADS